MQTGKGRRKFFVDLAGLAGSGIFLTFPFSAAAGSSREKVKEHTVGQIMDAFIKEVPGEPLKETVDTLKSGSRENKVTGVVTTMFATMEVIQKTIEAGANFIIAHEPTFYNHADATAWLEGDAVYKAKWEILTKNNITIWRNHDYVHHLEPDGVMTGVVEQLGWKKYESPKVKGSFELPWISLEELIGQLKQILGISMVRYVGELQQFCSRVIMMPGAAGGRKQIEKAGKYKPDVLIVGEVSEWETAEYVRDARLQGNKIALVVLGHAVSEEPGSSFMAAWIKKKFPAIPVHHIPAGNPFHFK